MTIFNRLLAMAHEPVRQAPLAMTLQEVIDGSARVTLVVHEDDQTSGWQYLVTDEWKNDDLRLVHASHLVRDDPSLNEVQSMPVGTYAARDDATTPWRYGDISELRTD